MGGKNGRETDFMDAATAAGSHRAFDNIAFPCAAHSISSGETDIKGLQGTVRAFERTGKE